MFKWVKNQFLAKLQVEKFISTQYVNFIDKVIDLLNEDKPLHEIIKECEFIKSEIIKKYNLTDKDLTNEKS